MKDPTIDTYDKIAHKYAEGHVIPDQSFSRKYEEFMHLTSGNDVLDVGCGPGRDSQYLLNKGYHVVGIDKSKGMLKEATARVPNGDFREMDMEALDFPNESFDSIWCNASLLHIKKSKAGSVLKGFKRVLRADGLLFISLKRGDKEEIKTYKDGTKRFFSYYKETEIFNLVEKDFKVIDIYTNTDKDGDVWINIFARPKLVFRGKR